MLKNQKRLASNAIKMGMLLLIVGLEGCLGGSGGTTASTTTSASTLSGVVAVGKPAVAIQRLHNRPGAPFIFLNRRV